MKFFETSTHNLLAYEAAAGVRHHVALSIVGHGASARKRLLSRKNRPGKFDQEFLNFLLTRSRMPLNERVPNPAIRGTGEQHLRRLV